MDIKKIEEYCFYGQQGFNELNELYEKFIKDLDKDLMMEIGTRYGHSAKIWEEIGFEKIILLDISFYGLLYELDNKFILIEGNSNNNVTFKKVSKEIDNSKLNFLFIDGGHSYGEVKKDFYLYKDFVKDNGVIVFHDLELPGAGVRKFFDEIKLDYKQTFEIKNDYYGYGILINN